MIRKKIRRIALVSVLVSSNLFSFSLNDVINDTVGDITNGLGGSFGLPSFSVKCETGIDNIDLYDACSIFNKIDVNLGGNFKIGGCTIKVADPLSCQRKALKNFCRSSIRNGENKAGEYRASVSNSIVSSSEELLGTGGKIVGDFTNCNYVNNMFSSKKTTSGKTLKEVYTDSSVKSIQKHGIFNSVTKDVRDCLKISKDESKCFKVSEWALPETMQDAEEDISTTTAQSNSNTSSYIKGVIETESQLSKKMSSKCSKSNSPESCIKGVASDSEHTKKRDAIISNIETSSAIRKKVIDKAATQKRSFVFRGSLVPQRLPIETRADYISGAGRATASDIVVENLFSTNVNLEKESMVILDNKLIDSSEPFLQEASNQKIKELF